MTLRVWLGWLLLALPCGTVPVCGAGFTEGTPFLVYAVAEADGRLVTSFCERSRPLSGAPRDGVDDLPVLEALAARTAP